MDENSPALIESSNDVVDQGLKLSHVGDVAVQNGKVLVADAIAIILLKKGRNFVNSWGEFLTRYLSPKEIVISAPHSPLPDGKVSIIHSISAVSIQLTSCCSC